MKFANLSRLSAALLLAFAVSPVFAQTISMAHPGNGVDYGRLARMDTLVKDYLEKGWVKGVVTLVIRDGHVIQYKGYGFSDAEAHKEMKRDDLFRLASQTKAVVSVALMQLFEQGKFTLDEPIADFIPAFKNTPVLDKFNPADTTYSTVPLKRAITFRDLLTHTSGLDYPAIGSPEMKAIYAKNKIPVGLGTFDNDLRERIDALAALPLVRQPGEKWTYSLGMDVAGCLVEVISGKTLEAYFNEHIFQPLGMKDSYFNLPASKAARLVTVYTEDSLHHVVRWTKERMGLDPLYPLDKKHYFSGGAGLTSTAWDYAIFLQALLNGGIYNGVRILAPRTVELMTSNQLPFSFNGDDNFGLGFFITSAKSGAKDVLHEGSYGWGGFFGTAYWVDPKAKLVGLIMTQHTPNSHGDLTHKLEQVIYQSLE